MLGKLRPDKNRKPRRPSTKAEVKLWSHLRSRALDGRKFIRRHPIGPYIVDFACREQRLVIEIDSAWQRPDEPERPQDQRLLERGYRVLRFRDREILENIEGVLEAVRFALAETAPHPAKYARRTLPVNGER
ncbi:MAG TPA: endonuclease domain-containing protein [Xanthobacteraceae bacterium]|nr:endonuclease domain-containing protein [Xanthobacteraceae bacterium]